MNPKSILISAALALCPWAASAETSTVYFNGDILTMEGDSPTYVEAVVVKEDIIAFAGDLEKARREAGEKAGMHDLKGHTLLPGFIDTWGHFALVAQDTLGVNVSYFAKDPPKTKAQLLEKLRNEGKPFNGWLVGTGYSEALLSDGALTLADLDESFPDQPVLIENISTLTGMANSHCIDILFEFYLQHARGSGQLAQALPLRPAACHLQSQSALRGFRGGQSAQRDAPVLRRNRELAQLRRVFVDITEGIILQIGQMPGEKRAIGHHADGIVVKPTLKPPQAPSASRLSFLGLFVPSFGPSSLGAAAT